MKEVKAYVRVNMLDKVIHSLEEAGFADLTVIDVKAIRHGLEHANLEYSLELAARYMNVAKIELAVPVERVGEAVDLICGAARTGRRGDGMVFVSDVERAEHISVQEDESVDP